MIFWLVYLWCVHCLADLPLPSGDPHAKPKSNSFTIGQFRCNTGEKNNIEHVCY